MSCGDAAEGVTRPDGMAGGTCGGGDSAFRRGADGGRCAWRLSDGRDVQFSTHDDDVGVHLGIGLFEGGLADAELLGDLGESLTFLDDVGAAGGGCGFRCGGGGGGGGLGFGGSAGGQRGGGLDCAFGWNFEGLTDVDAVGFEAIELHDLARADPVVHGDAPDSIAWADGVVGGSRQCLDRSFGRNGGGAAWQVARLLLQVIDILLQVVKAQVLVLIVGAQAGYFGAHLAGREAGLGGERWGEKARENAETKPDSQAGRNTEGVSEAKSGRGLDPCGGCFRREKIHGYYFSESNN